MQHETTKHANSLMETGRPECFIKRTGICFVCCSESWVIWSASEPWSLLHRAEPSTFPNLNTEMRFESEWGTNRRRRKKKVEGTTNGQKQWDMEHRRTKIKFMFMFFPIWFGKIARIEHEEGVEQISGRRVCELERTTIHTADGIDMTRHYSLNHWMIAFYSAERFSMNSHHLRRHRRPSFSFMSHICLSAEDLAQMNLIHRRNDVLNVIVASSDLLLLLMWWVKKIKTIPFDLRVQKVFIHPEQIV